MTTTPSPLVGSPPTQQPADQQQFNHPFSQSSRSKSPTPNGSPTFPGLTQQQLPTCSSSEACTAPAGPPMASSTFQSTLDMSGAQSASTASGASPGRNVSSSTTTATHPGSGSSSIIGSSPPIQQQSAPVSMGTITAMELLGGTPSASIGSRGKVEVKLFVGRLPRSVDEAALTPFFSSFGQVVETVIIRDKASGMHKGSAFIKMASITEADAAVRALHNIKVIDPQLGPIQVKYANGEPERLGLSMDSAQPGNDLGKLFVGSLSRGVTEGEVRQIFEPYGKIDEIVLMKDPATNQSRGCAFVKFAFKEDAIHAIKALQGIVTSPGCTRPLEVKFAENRRSAPAAASAVLPGGAASTPAAYAPVRTAVAQQPQQPSNLNPRSAGGWTEYFTADNRAYYHNESNNVTQWTKPADFDRLCLPSAAAAAAGVVPSSMMMTGGVGAGGGVLLAAAVAGGSDVAGPPGANVFVFHIPNEWTQNEFVAHFSHFGTVISCYIATDRATGRNKGNGFVSFDNIQSSANAVLGMNGYLVGSKRLKVSIKTGEENYVAHLLGPTVHGAPHHSHHPQAAAAALMGGGGGGYPPPNMAGGYATGPPPMGGSGRGGGLGAFRTSPY